MNRKPVKGFKGLYEVSECGKVFSLERVVKSGRRKLYTRKERMLKPETTKDGYKRVVLYKNGVATKKPVHRLVAEAFLRNPKKKPLVNHKNGRKCSNHKENLEWATHSENTIHAIETGLFVPKFEHLLRV